MRIEIDQSGKIENTEKATVVGFSNHKNKSILVSAGDKKKIQKYCRSIGKPRIYTYKTFSILIYLLLRSDIKKISHVTIDIEYKGWSHQIKDYLLNYFNKDFLVLDKRIVEFRFIGKKSSAHKVANDVLNRKTKPTHKAILKDIIDLI